MGVVAAARLGEVPPALGSPSVLIFRRYGAHLFRPSQEGAWILACQRIDAEDRRRSREEVDRQQTQRTLSWVAPFQATSYVDTYEVPQQSFFVCLLKLIRDPHGSSPSMIKDCACKEARVTCDNEDNQLAE